MSAAVAWRQKLLHFVQRLKCMVTSGAFILLIAVFLL